MHPIQHILILAAAFSSAAAEPAVPAAWRQSQTLAIPSPGFLKLALPPVTMDSLQANLADLRVFEAGGREVPYLIARPSLAALETVPVKSMTVSLLTQRTELRIETGVDQEIRSIMLETPGSIPFIKAAAVQTSVDGSNWQTVAEGIPFFRLPNGASDATLEIPPAKAKYLRVSISDERGEPVPISAALLETAAPDLHPPRLLAVAIADAEHRPGQTRLAVDLGAANVHLSSIELAPADPFFTRSVSVVIPKIDGREIRDEVIATGRISRAPLNSELASEERRVRIERVIPARVVTVILHDQDSPPLRVFEIAAYYRPFALGLYAEKPGEYVIASGNPHAPAPNYPLESFRADLARMTISEALLGPLTPNPDFREPEVLPGVAENGADINLEDWKFRKQIQITGSGVHELNIDAESLSLAASGLTDLRIVQNGKQLPYLLERTGDSVEFVPQWRLLPDPVRPTITQWEISLPYESLPLTRLSAQVATLIFQRSMQLHAFNDEFRGEPARSLVTQATWTRAPGQTNANFTLNLNLAPGTKRLLLETDNGDNPPIAIVNLGLAHPLVTLYFKGSAGEPLHLYFGNPAARAPQYDLAIAGQQLLQAEKKSAALAPLERLQPESQFRFTSRGSSAAFWIVLVAVVGGLLFIIARLLPAPKRAG